jgi:hypothetical protein
LECHDASHDDFNFKLSHYRKMNKERTFQLSATASETQKRGSRMPRDVVAVFAVGLILVGEAMPDMHHHWMNTAGHNHVDIPESVGRNFGSQVLVDSGAATTTATGLLNILLTGAFPTVR